jgi:hypothetical protein
MSLDDDIKNIVDLNFGWFGEEIGTAMSIYQVVVISSLLRRRCKIKCQSETD